MPTGNTYAIIVGISSYPSIKPLVYADKDALLFRDFLKTPAGGNVKAENIFCLINDSARAADFNVRAYSWLKRKGLKNGDRLYLYFSGHGDAMNEDNYFFLPYDCAPAKADNNYLGTGNINMHTVKTLFIKPLTLKGIDVLLIVDACRTNELPGSTEGQQNFTNYISEQKEGEIIMLSTGAGQVAMESPKVGNGHGLFTYYLIDGLSGMADKEGDAADNDGVVSFSELASWVKNKVKKTAKQLFGTEQIPFFCCQEKDQEPIALVDSTTYLSWTAGKNMQQLTGTENLFAINNKKGAKGIQDSTGTNTDTALIALYNKFAEAVKNEQLTGDSSAEYYYRRMDEYSPGSSLTQDVKYSLATEFINFGQEKINLFLSGKGMVHIRNMESEITKLKNNTAGDNSPNLVLASAEEQINKMKTLVETRYGFAADMVEKAIYLLKDEPELLTSIYPKFYFLKAASLDNNSSKANMKQAVTYCHKAIQQDSNAAYNHLLLGWLYLDLENDSSEYYFKKAVRLAPQWAYPLNGLGILYDNKNKPQEAIKYYTKAIAIDSLYADACQNLGVAYYELANADSAKKYYKMAIAIDSSNAYPYYNLGNLFSDSLKTATNKAYYFSVARGYLLKAMRVNPYYSSPYNKLASLYWTRNISEDRDSSLYYLKLCAAVINYDAKPLRSLASFYFTNLKDTAEAERRYKWALSTDSADIENYFQLANFYKAINQTKKSDYWLTRAAILEPNNAETYVMLGNLYSNKKNVQDTAYFYYQQALKLNDQLDYLYYDIGLFYYYKKNYPQAIIHYKKALVLDTTYAGAYNALGIAYDHLYDTVNAASYYKKALQYDSTYTSAYHNIGLLYKGQHNYADAKLNYLKAVNIDTTYIAAYYSLGVLYAELHQKDTAFYYFKKCINIDAGYAVAYNYMGIEYDNAGDTVNALKYYKKATMADTAFSNAYYNVGAIYNARKNYDTALLNYNKAIMYDSTNLSAYFDAGTLYSTSGNNSKAVQYFEKCVELDSAYAHAYNYLGISYDNLNDSVAAMKNYAKAVAINPGYASPYFNIARLYGRQNLFDSAIAYYNMAIAADSEFVEAYSAIGFVYDNIKDTVNAISNFEKAVKLDSTNTNFYNTLGVEFSRIKNYDKAVEAFRHIIAIDSNFTFAYYNLACIGSLQKNTGMALRYLELSFKKGYAEYAHVMADEDLTYLHEDAGFKALLRKYFPGKTK